MIHCFSYFFLLSKVAFYYHMYVEGNVVVESELLTHVCVYSEPCSTRPKFGLVDVMTEFSSEFPL